MTIHRRPRRNGAKRAFRRAMAYLRRTWRWAGSNDKSARRMQEAGAFPACYYVE